VADPREGQQIELWDWENKENRKCIFSRKSGRGAVGRKGRGSESLGLFALGKGSGPGLKNYPGRTKRSGPQVSKKRLGGFEVWGNQDRGGKGLTLPQGPKARTTSFWVKEAEDKEAGSGWVKAE